MEGAKVLHKNKSMINDDYSGLDNSHLSNNKRIVIFSYF